MRWCTSGAALWRSDPLLACAAAAAARRPGEHPASRRLLCRRRRHRFFVHCRLLLWCCGCFSSLSIFAYANSQVSSVVAMFHDAGWEGLRLLSCKNGRLTATPAAGRCWTAAGAPAWPRCAAPTAASMLFLPRPAPRLMMGAGPCVPATSNCPTSPRWHKPRPVVGPASSACKRGDQERIARPRGWPTYQTSPHGGAGEEITHRTGGRLNTEEGPEISPV